MAPKRASKSLLSFFGYVISRPNFSFKIAPFLLVVALVIFLTVFTGSRLPLTERFGDLVGHLVEYGFPMALLAIGAGLVLSTNGVDLSVAGTATLGGVISAWLLKQDVHPVFVLILVLMFGSGSGFLLGKLVAESVSALISSWALGTVWFVATIMFCNYTTTGNDITSSGISNVPSSFAIYDRSGAFLANLARPFLILGAIIFFLYFTNLVRQACAIGANADSATYAGIRVRRVTKLVYTVNGLLAAYVGAVWSGTTNTASTTVFRGYELIAIAMAVLGGTDMSGGFLNLFSVTCAAFLWRFLEARITTLTLSKLPVDQHQQIVNVGFAVVILVVALIMGNRRNRAMRTILVQRGAGG